MPPRPVPNDGLTELNMLSETITKLIWLRSKIGFVRTAVNAAAAAPALPAALPAAAPAGADQALLDHLCSFARKSVPSANGYLLETEVYLKNYVKVGRNVTSQGDADIRVDLDAGENKALQLKTVNNKVPLNVQNKLIEALGQLRGTGGEVAPDGSRWIASVVVRNPENPWPFDAGDGVPANPAAFRAKLLAKAKLAWQAAIVGIGNRLPGHAMTQAVLAASASAGRPHTFARDSQTNDVVGKVYYAPNAFALGDGVNSVWKVRIRFKDVGDPQVEIQDPGRHTL